MPDARALIDDVTLLNTPDAFALVLELRPPFEHHHKLEIAVMHVPMLNFVGIGRALRADDMGDIVAVRRALYAEVPILEYFAQPLRPNSL